MKVTVTTPQKRDVHPRVGNLNPGEIFDFAASLNKPRPPGRFQVIATEYKNSIGDLKEQMAESERVLCLNLNTGNFFLTDSEAEVTNVLKQGKTEIDWEG